VTIDESPVRLSLRVLLVEDDLRLARFTALYLEEHGVIVAHVTDGEAGLREARSARYDAVVLDLMLPKLDGLDVCRGLRKSCDVPLLVLTARADESDRILLLEVGADDYLTKPFSARELLARIRANVRRARGLVTPQSDAIEVGPLVLYPGTLRATLHGRDLPLTSYELALLRALAERPGRVLTREQLLDLAKGSSEESFDRSIDVRISRLRHKLGDDPKRPSMLKTVRGVGYVLVAADPQARCDAAESAEERR
jgi:two-component system, OmpR family, response regulator